MLGSLDRLMIRQQVEPLQVFTGLETANRYRVLDHTEQEVLYCYEESRFLGRQVLGGHRPLTLQFLNPQGDLQLTARRGFFWFFSHLEMTAPDGTLLGRMERRFKPLSRLFHLEDREGPPAEVVGTLLRPNTFWVRCSGRDIAKITKRWSGARELLTVADHFSVEYLDASAREPLRWLVLAAAFAIDLDFFERRR